MNEDRIPGRLDDAQDDWNLERREKRESTRRPRAVVSVAFSREDLELVEMCASKLGKKLSEFIREASLARARVPEPIRPVVTFGGMASGSFFSPDVSLPTGGTRTPSAVLELEASELVPVIE